MSKHTKGPWTAFIWDKSEPYKITIGASQADGGPDHVCRAEFTNGMADARLIAAAPEMLSVLKQIEHECNGDGSFPLMGFVLDAIAKAEGKE